MTSPIFGQDLEALLSTEPAQLSPSQIETLAAFTVTIDTIAEDVGVLSDVDLTGYSTYRLYITTNSEQDKVSSIYGDLDEPLSVETTGDFFQSSPIGGVTAEGIIPLVWGTYPSNEFDSYVTVGIDEAPSNEAGELGINLLQSGNDSWVTYFEPEDDSYGGDFEISDLTGGGWFVLPSATNGIAGPEKRVLIAQFTTNGTLSGVINAQIFLEGDNINGTVYLTLTLPVEGCDDETACNYDEEATINDGSCLFADAPCESCLDGELVDNDLDDDGVCDDVDDCIGTLDACNVCNGPGEIYDCGCADIPAGECDCDGNQEDALGVCGGSCTADADNDGICDDVDDCVGTLDACNVCNGPGEIYDCGCADIPAGDCDCNGNQEDALGVCGGSCAADADNDGICDDVDDCVGTLDACNVCNGPGEIYDCGCADIPAGECDCDGNQEDALGVCGGSCTADADNDGICDDVDDCVGTLDACNVCNGPGEIYDCGCADIPTGECDCDGNQEDALGVCGGSCAADADNDGICDDVDDCVGTLDACNVCNGPGEIYDCGCADIPAGECDCNGNQEDALGVCGGACTADADNDGICDDVDDCVGTLDACNVCNGPGEIYDCGCADIPAGECDCDGNQEDALGVCGGSCTADADNDGICDDVDDCVGTLDACNVCNGPGEIYDCGCTDIPAGECDCDGNQEDALGVCGGSCAADADNDGICDDVDDCVGTLDACNVCNGPGEIYDCGCADIPAGECDCNGNQEDALGVCGGACTADADNDGICDDVDDCVGTLDACNVCNGPGEIYDCGCADIPAGECDCDGNQEDALGVCGGSCTADADNDGICDDVDDCVGTLDACNVCNGPGEIYDCGCTDIPAGECDCDGNQEDALGVCGGSCAADADNDGICDDVDDCVGTLDACNVCNGPGEIYDCGCADIPAGECDCNGNQEDALGVCGGACTADADNDGICDDVDDCVGTLDACNVCNGPGEIYDCGCADIPAGECDCDGNQEDALGVCGGACTADADNDGICDDVDDCVGTLDACNVCNGPGEIYDCGCTDIPAGECDCNGNQEDALGVCGGSCAADADNDGICDDVDDCVGTLDACNVCNGPGEIYDCGCADIPAGECDCDGNQEDALGVCGGSCAADADNDGICDDVDDCVGTLDACNVCNGPGEIYDCGCADIPAGECDCDGNQEDALGVCGGSCAADADNDGICDDVDNCTDLSACNFDGTAGGSGDCVTLSLETYAVHTSGNLNGQTTYRLYAVLPNSDDFLSAVKGEGPTPLNITTTTSFYQNEFGGADGTNINAQLFGFDPELQYDSWVTIGHAPEDGPAQINLTTATSPGQDWINIFEGGGDIVMDDTFGGLWSILNDGNTQGLAGDDNKVLIAQLTTDGNIDAQIEVQYFPNYGCCANGGADGTQDLRSHVDLSTACNANDDCAYTDACGVCGGEGTDEDNDGICDDVDDCVGELDICGVCNGSGPQPGFDCNGDPIGDGCSPFCLSLDTPLEDQVFDCPEDLESVSCQTDLTASNFCNEEPVGVSCSLASRRLSETVCNATTALGVGQDGALVLFGIEGYGVASTYYEPTAAGLTLTQYPNSNTAVLEGEVQGTADPTEKWSVYITYENAVSGADWNGGFKSANECTPTSDITDSWTIYTMKNDQSFLVGTGALDGSLLFLNHAPMNAYFGFQVGEMANDRNCDYGAGGWFAWEGQINGQPVAGANGDVLVNLECSENTVAPCDEEIILTYSLVDTACATLTNVEQSFTFLDDVPPTFDNAPADVTLSCNDPLPAIPTLTATDNCTGNPSPVVIFNGEAETSYTADGCRTLERSWLATDACNNTRTHTQTITIEDLDAPVITMTCPADAALFSDADCNAETGIDALGSPTVTATDNCTAEPGIELTHEDGATTSTCEGQLTFTRTWTATATDDCGNTAIQTCAQSISIQDLIAPTIAGDTIVTMSCDAYDEATLYAISATDNCSTASISVLSNSAFSGACAGTVLRTYEATDDCGNSSTFEQVINLTDDVAPAVTIACPAGATLAAGPDCTADLSVETLGTATATATDNCDTAPEVEISHTDVLIDLCAGSQRLERTWTATATDHCDNVSTTSCLQVVLIEDVTPPSLTLACPDDAALEVDDMCTASTLPEVTGTPTFETSDNCGGSVAVSLSHTDSDTIPGCGNTFSFTRTWTAVATDDCGNAATATCAQNIALTDVTAPDFGDAAISVSAPCDQLLDPEDPTLVPVEATDNCSEVTYSIAATELSGGCPGTWERVWTATDACNNSSSFTQYVALFDTIAPAITCPLDTVLYLDANCEAALSTALLGMASADDNCSSADEIAISFADGAASLSCTGDDENPEGSRTIVRTFTATDFCDNVTACSQTITLLDTIAPQGSASNETVACAEFDSMVEYGTASATDNCDSEVAYSWVEDGIISTLCENSYEVQRTYTFVDDCGNSSTAIQVLTVVDDTAPVVIGDMHASLACDAYGDDPEDPANILITATDDCGEVSITFMDLPFSGGCVMPFSTLMRQYNVSDDCGNTTVFLQFIDLIDTVGPVITLDAPAPVQLFSDADCMFNADTSITGVPGITAFDNCSPDVTLTMTMEDGPLDTLCAGSYVFTRTFIVTGEDYCDNATVASSTQEITITDNTAPVLTCPADLTVECDGAGNATALANWLASAVALDNCSEATITNDFVGLSDGCGATGAATVTFTATDDCGNASQCSATFTIADSTAPVVSPAADLTVHCDGAGNTADLEAWLLANGDATAQESCSDATWSNDFSALEEACGSTGAATVTFTATDDCGNAASTSATFSIIDTIAPDFSGSSYTFEIACDLYDETTLYGLMVDDVCGLDTVYVSDIVSVSGGCPAGYLRTYMALDACGNSSTFQQAVNLIDTVAPMFTSVPADYVALCHEDHPLDDAAATDNCAETVSITVTADTTAGDCPQAYTVTRTFTAEDGCENTTTAIQVIQIVDTLAPSFAEALPGDITADCHAVPAAATLTATDLCSDVSVTFAEDTTFGDCPQTYVLTRTWNAADACGNAISHTQVVNVQDVTAPSIDAPAMDLTVECDGQGNVFDYLNWQSSQAGATASDLCGTVTWSHTVDNTSDACEGATGSSTVTFTATDECGNSASTTATFTIADTQAPIITAEDLVEVMCADYSAEAAYGFSATDACSDISFTIADTEIEGSCAGSFERIYTVTDACGNEATATQIVHLYDSIAPVFTSVPDNADLQCGSDFGTDALGMAAAEDNCDGDVSITYLDAIADSTGADCYTIQRVWTATDACGNAKSVTQTITISDDEAPALSVSFPADLQLEADATCSAATGTDETGEPSASATDNCDLDVLVSIAHSDSIADGCEGAYTIFRTWTVSAADNCGNSASETAVQTIAVVDVTAPTLAVTGPVDQVLDQTAGCDLDTSVDALGTVGFEASDACDPNPEVTVTHTDGPLVYSCISDDSIAEGDYSFTRTFTVTATDACGNAETLNIEQTISVLDQLPPQFTETCGLDNGASVSVCCDDAEGSVIIPDSCAVQFQDNCDSEVDLTYTESYVGAYAPTADVISFCSSSLPAPFEDGETCNGMDPHNLRLFNLPGGEALYAAVTPGTVEQRADGTWMLSQSVTALDGSGNGWDIEATFDAALDWNSWDNQDFPTGYKRDCSALIDGHEEWDYRIMQSGTLTGTGGYTGSTLSLTHAPANQYYAFQIGMAANNMNNAYGYSGWFAYSGTFDGQAVIGSGDLFGDLDCCLPWSIERNYLLLDDCGNASTFGYTIAVNGTDCSTSGDAEVSGQGDTDHTPGIIGGAGDVVLGKSPIRVTNLQPNPTNDWSQLGFEVSGNMRVQISMFSMDGLLIADLYDGVAAPGVNHSLDIPADDLQSGMYQIRLSNAQYMVVKKLLVTD